MSFVFAIGVRVANGKGNNLIKVSILRWWLNVLKYHNDDTMYNVIFRDDGDDIKSLASQRCMFEVH